MTDKHRLLLCLMQACAYGCVPVVMTFDADLLHISRVPHKGALHLVLVDLKASKDTTTILRDLQSAYPRAQDEKQERLQQLLGEVTAELLWGLGRTQGCQAWADAQPSCRVSCHSVNANMMLLPECCAAKWALLIDHALAGACARCPAGQPQGCVQGPGGSVCRRCPCTWSVDARSSVRV